MNFQKTEINRGKTRENLFQKIIKKMKKLFKNEDGKKQKFLFFKNFGIGEEKEYLMENLAMLITSGMGVVGALDAIKTEIRSKRIRTMIEKMKTDIEAGSTLWAALEKTGLFAKQAISLMRIGEESGNLTENLKVIAQQQQKDRNFSSKLTSAMMYPCFVLGLTFMIGIGIAWFILPKLTMVFSQMKMKLPFITQILIAIGNFLGTYGSIAVPLFCLALGTLFYFTFFFHTTKFIGQSIILHIPGIKQLIKEVELARFGYIFGSLLNAGLPITEAIESLTKTSAFLVYQRFYLHLQKSINEGNSFQKSFAQYPHCHKLIPGPIQQLIVAGERSGNLAEITLKISTNFEEKIENTTKNLTVILEPILLVIVWLGVVAVALAIVLPIYSLVGGLNS